MQAIIFQQNEYMNSRQKAPSLKKNNMTYELCKHQSNSYGPGTLLLNF